MLAGEVTAWSAGAAATDNGGADRERDGVNDNGNGAEKLEERPAPVTDRVGRGPVIGFTERICATASAGIEAETNEIQRANITARTLF
jgi:hypothetical protein